MKKIKINNVEYEVVREDNNCINIEELSEKITEYFDNFDYIFGDFSYDKVRLKGFNDSNNKHAKKINDIKVINLNLKMYHDVYKGQTLKFYLKSMILLNLNIWK